MDLEPCLITLNHRGDMFHTEGPVIVHELEAAPVQRKKGVTAVVHPTHRYGATGGSDTLCSVLFFLA
jgi:hypothetical protein